MGPLLVLCLCVLTEAQWSTHASVPALEPKAVTPVAEDGDGFSTDLSWVKIGIPTSSWAVSAWIFIVAAADNAMLLLVHISEGKDAHFIWSTSSQPVFNNGDEDKSDPLHPVRENGKWFHVIFGSSAGSTFGVITTRGSATQVDVTWVETIKVNRASFFKGPVGDPNFSVRAM